MEEGLRWWAHCSRWWNTAQVSKHNHFIQNTEMLLKKPLTGHLMWCPVWAAASLKHVKRWREYLTSDKIIWRRLGDCGSSEPSSSVGPWFCPEKWFRNHFYLTGPLLTGLLCRLFSKLCICETFSLDVIRRREKRSDFLIISRFAWSQTFGPVCTSQRTTSSKQGGKICHYKRN